MALPPADHCFKRKNKLDVSYTSDTRRLHTCQSSLLARSSLALRDETRDSGLHYRIESLSGLDFIDLVKSGLWNSGDIEVLPGAGWSLCSGENCRATLNCPSQQNLRRGLVDFFGGCQYCRVFQRARFYPVTQARA